MNVHQEPSPRDISLEFLDDGVELVVDLFRAGVTHRGLHDVPVGVALGPVICWIHDLQGDPSGLLLAFVDIKTQVLSQYNFLILN